MNEIAIKAENLSKIYKLYDKPINRLKETLSLSKKIYSKEFYALNNLNFEVKKGETLGIIGTNGSGKSTLLKLITGVLTPSQGTVIVSGKISALLELGAGFNPEYTGIANIYLNGTMMGYSKQEIDNKISQILQFADIGNFINQPVKSYSSGMFARLAFAVAINVDPDILIVDEALAVGDIDFQLKCMDKFNEFRSKGKTILYVSHDLSSVKRYCNRCVWIQNGRMECIGETNMVTDKYLDFLKNKNDNDNNIESHYIKATDIGEITDLEILKANNKVSEINFGEEVNIKLSYNMYKNVEGLVLGIAIRTIDHRYICGLNTLLDKYKIEYSLGKNVLYLNYKNVNLIGGSYYFDAGMFEKNAHVPIDYRSKIKEFFVNTPYVGEGTYILDHEWKKNI